MTLIHRKYLGFCSNMAEHHIFCIPRRNPREPSFLGYRHPCTILCFLALHITLCKLEALNKHILYWIRNKKNSMIMCLHPCLKEKTLHFLSKKWSLHLLKKRWSHMIIKCFCLKFLKSCRLMWFKGLLLAAIGLESFQKQFLSCIFKDSFTTIEWLHLSQDLHQGTSKAYVCWLPPVQTVNLGNQ